MTTLPAALAVTGSCSDGGCPFSAAARGPRGVEIALPAAGERGDLAVLAQRACAAAGIGFGELREVRVDRGPGSYVGLRVAVTFARCLAEFAPARLCVADSLSVLVAATLAPTTLSAARIRAVIDARRGRVHAGTFVADQDGFLAPAGEPSVVPIEQATAGLRAGDLLVAPAALASGLAAAAARAGAELRPAAAAHAGHLFAPALRLAAVAADALEPLYLMGSYAQ